MAGMFFMNTNIRYIRNNKNPTKKDLYQRFYKQIQDKQVNNAVFLKMFTDLIDHNVRIINVVTEDLLEQTRIKEKTALLMNLDRDIREKFFGNDAKFLEALNVIFAFNNDFK